jgi:hypothetical protein
MLLFLLPILALCLGYSIDLALKAPFSHRANIGFAMIVFTVIATLCVLQAYAFN